MWSAESLINVHQKASNMLLSHVNHFIYTKTLKAAGTSVEIYFQDACIPVGKDIIRSHHIEETVTSAGIIGYRGPDQSGRTWYNHMPAVQIRELVGHSTWEEYYKFCVVRNPFDKVVSLWWFSVNRNQENPYKDESFSRIRSDFSAWCPGHAADAVDRDKYLIDGDVSVDFFIRYESLLDGMDSVCRRIGYPFRPERLGKYKSDSRAISQPFGEYYDRSAIAAVEAAFGWELEYFGYRRPSETAAFSPSL
jgi:hypothetical protein